MIDTLVYCCDCVFAYVTVGRTKSLIHFYNNRTLLVQNENVTQHYTRLDSPFYPSADRSLVNEMKNRCWPVNKHIDNRCWGAPRQRRTINLLSPKKIIHYQDNKNRSEWWKRQNNKKKACMWKPFQIKNFKIENEAIWLSSIERNIQNSSSCVTSN